MNMKTNSLNSKLFVTVFIFFIIIISSCGSSNNSDYMFNSHDEILNVFKEVMIDKNIVSKSGEGSRYSFTSGENGTDSYKLVKINSTNTNYHNFNGEENHSCVNINGDFVIGSTEKGEYKCRINFHISKGDSLTVKNILKHNELDFKDEYITLNYTKGPRGDDRVEVRSYLANGINIINGNGVLLRDNRYIRNGGYYLKKYIKDTLEYSKTVNGKLEGKSFKSDIVYLHQNWYEGTSLIKPNFSLFDGKTVKYLESEENYVDGKKSGEQVYRKQGIVTKKQISENGDFINEIEYTDGVFPSKSGSLLTQNSQNQSSFVNFLWSNQEKFKIDIDKKGYQSYSPLVKKIENRKGIVDEKYGLIYKRHGKFETNQFQPIKSDTYNQYGKWIPEIRATYNKGKLEGNVIVYNRHEKELLNLMYKNGILIKGVKNEYYEDYNNGTYTNRLTKTVTINNDKINYKIFDSNGGIVDEGIEKIDPIKYSESILDSKLVNER
jgi:hypothetical protein